LEDPMMNPSRQLPAGKSPLMGSRMYEGVPGIGEEYAEFNNRTPSRSGLRGTENQQKYHTVSFGTALKKLYKRLEAAEQFYTEFQRGFKEETAAVKKYAAADVMTELWILKVKGEGGIGQDTENGAEEYGNEDESPEDVAERFQGEYEKVVESMKGVLAAKVTNGLQSRVKPTNRAAKIERFKEKLSLGDEHLQLLFLKTSHKQDYCKDFVGELEYLKKLIDPAEGENAILYKADGDIEDVEGNADEGQQY